ncbi:ATP-binding protein [Lagierella sp. ICN-221743]
MTLLNLDTFSLTLLFIINMIILIISMEIVIMTANNKTHSRFFIFALSIFILSFIPVQVLAEIGRGRFYISKNFINFPLQFLILYNILICMLEFILIKDFSKTKNKSIGHNSIKESMDNLTNGICFSKLDGTPLLVNRMMQDISYEVFGKMLVNDVVCAENIKNNKIRPSTIILQRDPLVFECLGEIWQIKVIYHGSVRETIAYNITLEWALYKEIEKKIKQIQKINESLRDYQKNVGEYTRQKEILKAKIKIHDKIGQSLIYFKRYLEKTHKTKEERDKLIKLWMESLLILEDSEDRAENKTKFEKLISTANDIGVEVHVNGKAPSNETDWILLVDIVHEALNNAIRHGQAKNIWIYLYEDEFRIQCEIENDGLKAKESIVEKGGLKNIRQRLEPFDGTIKIFTKPNFKLELSWIKGENYDL